MIPLDIILNLLSYSCYSSQYFYKCMKLTKYISLYIKKYKEIMINIEFKLSIKYTDYFIKNIHLMNKDNWIRNINLLNNDKITDCIFVHLKGIHTLNMRNCDQNTITDNAFIHLKGIHTLNMKFCDQNTITDKAFIHLKRIHTLKILGCNNSLINK